MNLLRKQKFYQMLTIVIWLTFLFIVIVSGNLKIFIRKNYVPFTIAGTLILFILFIIKIKRFKKEVSPQIDFMTGISFLAFLFPVFLTSIVRPGNLSTFAAAKRGVITEFEGGNILETLKAQIEKEDKYRKLNIKQLLAFASKKPEMIENKLVAVEGIVFKNKNEKNKFILIRFLITCCAADATPLGVEVYYDRTDELRKDMWVKVKGKAEIKDGKVFIIAESIEKIPPPSDPYLY